ncbi:hypothetical protein ACEPAI_1726 [Sanghuangporus weigelae]
MRLSPSLISGETDSGKVMQAAPAIGMVLMKIQHDSVKRNDPVEFTSYPGLLKAFPKTQSQTREQGKRMKICVESISIYDRGQSTTGKT